MSHPRKMSHTKKKNVKTEENNLLQSAVSEIVFGRSTICMGKTFDVNSSFRFLWMKCPRKLEVSHYSCLFEFYLLV